jgi:uncharacterized protein
MSQRTSYTQGTPCWVDLLTTDPQAAKSFYGQLFGWRYDDVPMPEGPVPVYSMAVKDDGVVAAITQQPPEMAAQGLPPRWNTYLAVDDADEVAARVEPAGGKLLMAPFDVMGAGRMAVVTDPTGAAVGLWQAKGHIGAARVNEPGTMCWNELLTDNEGAAVAFYQRVLGLTTSTMEVGGAPHTVFLSGTDTVAGTAAAPSGVSPHWHVFFAVEDVPAAAQQATELGGTVLNGPMDISIGTMATLRDPQGGVFGIFAAKPATS